MTKKKQNDSNAGIWIVTAILVVLILGGAFYVSQNRQAGPIVTDKQPQLVEKIETMPVMEEEDDVEDYVEDGLGVKQVYAEDDVDFGEVEIFSSGFSNSIDGTPANRDKNFVVDSVVLAREDYGR